MWHTCRAQNLYLHQNKIGDAGVTALANACAGGALAQCTSLNLAVNKIGDKGLEAFAVTLASGALVRCSSIILAGNPDTSEEAKKSVQLALKSRWLDGDFLAKNLSDVKQLDCSGLGWGDTEMTKLVAALEHCHTIGAMAQLQVTWRLTVLIPHLETWRTRSPCLTVLFDVPYVPCADA